MPCVAVKIGSHCRCDASLNNKPLDSTIDRLEASRIVLDAHSSIRCIVDLISSLSAYRFLVFSYFRSEIKQNLTSCLRGKIESFVSFGSDYSEETQLIRSVGTPCLS